MINHLNKYCLKKTNIFTNYTYLFLFIIFILTNYSFYFTILKKQTNIHKNLIPSFEYSVINEILLTKKNKNNEIKKNLLTIFRLNSQLKNFKSCKQSFEKYVKTKNPENLENAKINFKNLKNEIKEKILSDSDLIRIIFSKIYFVIFFYLIVFLIFYFSLKNNISVLQKEKTFLYDLANKDELTNLFNRRYLNATLQSYERQKNGLSYGIIILDIDNFKDLNDKFGHQYGDLILKTIAKILINNLRKTDIAGRWGGEEFMCIVITDNKDMLFQIAENIRKIIEKSFSLKPHKLSASFGCDISEKKSYIEVIENADKALYRAKDFGKNRVEIY